MQANAAPVRPAATLSRVLRLLRAEADREVALRLAAALLVVAAAGLLTALAPLALKALIDLLAAAQVTPAGIASAALPYAFAYVAALCAGRLLNDFRPFLMGAAEQRLRTRLGKRFFAHLLNLPASFHLDRKTGALAHSLVQASAASQLILTTLVQSLPLVVELLTVLVVLAHLSQPELVAIFLVSSVAYGLVFLDGTRRVRARSRATSMDAMASQAAVADALLNIETIKCFDVGATVNQRFAGLSAALERSWLYLHQQRMTLGLAATAVFAASVATSFALSIVAVERGTLTLGGFVLASVYILQMIRPVEALGAGARDIGQAIEFITPALAVLDLPGEAATAMPPKADLNRSSPMAPVDIRLQHVHLAYPGGPPVLHGLDLHIPAGRTLAIVGPSGAGKSSVARLLLGLVMPDAGRILVNRVAADRLGPGALRAMIGVVSQDVLLFDDTIAFNVQIARPRATQADIEQACRAAHIHDFIASLPAGYDTPIGERGLKLSGGERQRLAIARAVLKQPAVFLFDEATSALDSRTEAEVAGELRCLCAGRTTVLITHRLAVARHADQIALLQGGRIQELGTHHELLRRRGAYAGLYQAQTGEAEAAHHLADSAS